MAAVENAPDAGANPSAPFILRPVATTLFIVAIVLAGFVAYRFLPLAALPQVDYPTIQVRTLYPGASPDVMSLTVTSPLERQLGQMTGLNRMSSVSSAGASVITLQFKLELNLDVAEQEVQEAINAASLLLPTDLPAPPIYAKVNPSDAPIITIGVTSNTRPLAELESLVDQHLANKISQVSGVGLVTLSGGERPALRIRANVQALASLGISLDTLRTVIANANVNGPKGIFDGPTRSWSIDANDQLLKADDYRNLVVAYVNKAPVRLSAVADVVESVENTRIGSWLDRTPAVIVDVQRQPGANVITTVDAIKAELPDLVRQLPADVHARVLADRTEGIRASVRDVQLELVLAAVLVTLAVFLFLGNARATIVATAAVPVSLVGTFGAMYLCGYSIDNLSLMALTIASGFVVDDAIVVTENIARYLEAGDSPFDAALKGSKQIGFTVISLTISLIAALIPLLFMSDVIGRLFRAFAATLAITILISAVVALTLVPMLSARYLTSAPSNPPLFQRRVSAAFERVRDAYGRALDWVLAHQTATLAVFGATLLATAALAVAIPKGLFPIQDTGQLEAFVVASQEVSFARMAQLQADVAGVVLADPEVENLSSSIGVDGRNPALNQGRMLINLKPKRDRGSQAALIERLQQAARNVAGVTLYVRPVQDLTIDAEDGPTQYRLALQGTDPAELSRWGHALMAQLADEPKVRNVVSDIFDGGKAVTVNIDRVDAARLGINTAAIDSALYDAFGQRIVSTIFTHSTQYRVVLESQPEMLQDPNALDRLYIPTGSGPAVPLGMVATVSVGDAPLTIARTAHFPSATIGFDPAPGVSLGAAVDAVTRAVQELGLPPTVSTKFLGAADAFRTSLVHEGWLIVAAIVVVYIVLGVLYESFIHPVTILSTLPAAAIGALLALMITRDDLGVLAVIGIVLLIGIVKKNAIMMIDFALHAQREDGLSPTEAIKQAALLRFRPIMMTTFAALFAALPLIFGTGMGSEMREPVGVSIAGGLILSQALTLFTTPVVFLAFTRLTARHSRAAPQFAAAPNRADEVASP